MYSKSHVKNTLVSSLCVLSLPLAICSVYPRMCFCTSLLKKNKMRRENFGARSSVACGKWHGCSSSVTPLLWRFRRRLPLAGIFRDLINRATQEFCQPFCALTMPSVHGNAVYSSNSFSLLLVAMLEVELVIPSLSTRVLGKQRVMTKVTFGGLEALV